MQTKLLQQKESWLFNQLNPLKDISNFFTPKKCVNKRFTEHSFQIRIFENYISVPKRFCFLDKNKKNYLIGIKPGYVYNCYDAQKNWREKLTGYELIKKYNLKGFHFLTVEKQRFANMQKVNPFLMQFKNVQESMEWHRKQVVKEREELKMFLIKNKKNTDTKVSDNNNLISKNTPFNIISKINANYEKKLYQTTKKIKQQLDINQLLIDLDNPIIC